MRLITLFLIILFVCTVNAGIYSESKYKSLFTSFTKKYNKKYIGNVFSNFFSTFKSNLDKIAEFNAKNKGFKLAINRHLDAADDKSFGLYPINIGDAKKYRATVKSDNTTELDLPKSLDWREKGAVNKIQYQGSCGSCWAFSTIGALESRYFIKYGKLEKLSEQYLVDCANPPKYSTQGCNGGSLYSTYDFIRDNGGLCKSTDYSEYEFRKRECINNCTKIIPIKGSKNGGRNDLEIMKELQNGPIVGAVYASSFRFKFYSSGVFEDEECTKASVVNHGIVIVGYGTENGTDYWLIRNSWHTDWGEKGYMKLARNKNMCLINTYNVVPTFEDDTL